MTLNHFREEKEAEIKKLQEQLKSTEFNLAKSEVQNKDLAYNLSNEKKMYETRQTELRRKLDLMFK